MAVNMIRIPSLRRLNRKKVVSEKRALLLFSGRPRGSMALEGSLALPLFLFYMMTVLLGLEAVRFQSDMQQALHQAGNRKAFMEYQVKYMGGAGADVQGQVREYLGNQLYPYLPVAGGEAGLAIQDLSSAEDGRVELSVEYGFKPFIGWLPIGDIRVREGFFSHSWTGYCGGGGATEREPETYVYVTETGSRYHLSVDCTYLRVKIQAIAWEELSGHRNQSGGKYRACLKCRPVKGGLVYITADGGSYHGDGDCSALKRTIRMIPLREAQGYGACSRCSG